MNKATTEQRPPLLCPEQRASLATVAAAELPAMLASVLSALPRDTLSLSDCTSRGGMIDPEDWSLSTLHVDRTAATLTARLSVFFTEIVGGCNCHDEPARYNEHAIFRADIDLGNGQVRWSRAEA